MSDSISDFLTVIRNAYAARKDTTEALYSKMHTGIAQILKDEGYIQDFRESSDGNGHKNLVITLKYVSDEPAINTIERRSRPGRRLYFKSDEVPRVLNGMGIGILTTSRGLMKDRDARRQKVGGELVCAVW
jgi:small subunit ribosomal protein S8